MSVPMDQMSAMNASPPGGMMDQGASPAPPMPPPSQKPSLMMTDTVGKQSKKHSHAVYLRPDGSGMSSEDAGHAHDFVLMPMPMGGYGRACSPAPDGHTHTLMDLSMKPKGDGKAAEEIASEVRSLRKSAMEYEADSRKKGEESERFAKGEQWTSKQRSHLDSQDRACLTINEAEPKLDILSGYQRQNRTDIKFLPVEEGDARVADILNAIVKNICDQNNFEYEETRVFWDEMVTGRGLFNLFIDRDANPKGDIVIEQFPWKECWFGPHEKYDASDAEYVVKSKWYSKANIDAEWPEKSDKLSPEPDPEGKDDKHQGPPGTAYDTSINRKSVSIYNDPDHFNKLKKEYRIIECQRKEYRRVPVVMCSEDDFSANVDGMDAGVLKSLSTIPCLTVIKSKKTRIRLTTVSCDVVLSDDRPEDMTTEFSVVPVYAKKSGADWWGKVESIKDAQRSANKLDSQIVDILNKAAAYGWFTDANTFATPQEKEKFKRNSSSPGFVAEVQNTDRPPRQVEGVKFPAEVANLRQMKQEQIRELMNVNPELMGINSKAESGVAIVEKKRQGLLGNEFLFDNLSLSKKTMGKILVHLIQKVYDPERILRVIENRNQQTPVEIAGKKMEEYPREELKALLENADLTKYDVAVAESAHSPTIRNANFIAWAALAQQGIPVPPDLLVELSDLDSATKERVKAAMKAQAEAAAAQEKAKMDSEVQKTLISAQSKGGGTGAPAGGMPMQ